MSFPRWQLFTGADAILYFNAGSGNESFGHGQRLRELTLTRNYSPIYTIGSRELTAIPRGQYRVSWGVDVALSNVNILCLVFSCTTGQTSTIGTTLTSPRFFTIDGWLRSGSLVRRITMNNATITDMTLTVDSGRPEVSVSLTGIARDVVIAEAGTPPTISLPTRMFVFADARLLIGATEVPVIRAEMSIRQGAEPVYHIGDDRYGAVYLGEYEVELSIDLPASTTSWDYYLKTLVDNGCVSGLVLELRSCSDPVCTTGVGTTTIRFTFNGPGRVMEYRGPITEIGLNEASITMRFRSVSMEITTSS